MPKILDKTHLFCSWYNEIQVHPKWILWPQRQHPKWARRGCQSDGMEALQHFKVRKSVAHLHGEWCEAKQSEKNVPCVLSSCLDVWSLASVPMSPSSANICPDPSPAVSGLAIVMWPIGHNLCDPVFCSQATSIIWVWHRVFIISPIVTPPSYWPQICVYLFGSNLTPSIGSHCVYIPFLQVTKKIILNHQLWENSTEFG